MLVLLGWILGLVCLLGILRPLLKNIKYFYNLCHIGIYHCSCHLINVLANSYMIYILLVSYLTFRPPRPPSKIQLHIIVLPPASSRQVQIE